MVSMDFMDYVNQGYAFCEKGEFKLAIDNYKLALKIQPNNPDLQFLLKSAEERIFLDEQIYKKMAEEAEGIAKLIRTMHGINIDDIDNEIAKYTKALNQNHNDTSAKGKLGDLYYLRGLTFNSKKEFTKAIADYSEILKFDPNNKKALYKRGIAYEARKNDLSDFDKSVADFEKLMQIDPENYKKSLSNAYSSRGREFDKKRNYDQAISDFEKSLKLNPNDDDVREIIEMVKAKEAKR
jgi:tetratricopeptide (TPR) repeat protein